MSNSFTECMDLKYPDDPANKASAIHWYKINPSAQPSAGGVVTLQQVNDMAAANQFLNCRDSYVEVQVKLTSTNDTTPTVTGELMLHEDLPWAIFTELHLSINDVDIETITSDTLPYVGHAKKLLSSKTFWKRNNYGVWIVDSPITDTATTVAPTEEWGLDMETYILAGNVYTRFRFPLWLYSELFAVSASQNCLLPVKKLLMTFKRNATDTTWLLQRDGATVPVVTWSSVHLMLRYDSPSVEALASLTKKGGFDLAFSSFEPIGSSTTITAETAANPSLNSQVRGAKYLYVLKMGKSKAAETCAVTPSTKCNITGLTQIETKYGGVTVPYDTEIINSTYFATANKDWHVLYDLYLRRLGLANVDLNTADIINYRGFFYSPLVVIPLQKDLDGDDLSETPLQTLECNVTVSALTTVGSCRFVVEKLKRIHFTADYNIDRSKSYNI